jgi:hypothetical protein
MALVVDAEIVDLTSDEAAKITSRIRTWVKAFPAEDVKRAYFGRVWLAMGYSSWDEWCDCELNGFKLPAVEHREVVAELAESGMSNVAIGNVIGVSDETVRRDKAASTFVEPDKITGQDGKKYRRKPRPAPMQDAENRAENSRAALDEFATLLHAAAYEAQQVTTLDFLTADEAKALLPNLDEFEKHYHRLIDWILYRVTPYAGRAPRE